MNVVELEQGTEDWKRWRLDHFTASDAAAMMGEHPYKTRNQLLIEKATGATQDVSEFTQRLFDRGHEAEARAREIVQHELGEELFPLVGTWDEWEKIAASFDGVSLSGLVWECKLMNQQLREATEIPDWYRWQLEQQLMVADQDTAWFTAYDLDTGDIKTWQYTSSDETREQLCLGWERFEIQLREFDPSTLEVVDVSQEAEFALAESKYLVAQSALDEAKQKHDEAREALLSLANGRRCKTSFFLIQPKTRKGSIAYAKAIKELLPGADLEPYRAKDTTFFEVRKV